MALVTLTAFEAMAVATAMPVAAEALNGVRGYGLAFSLFLTMSLLGTVLAGGWGDSAGPRGPMLLGLGLFVGGLLVSGLATTFAVMVVGRAVSGVGAGLMVVALYVVIAVVYPQTVQPRMFSMVSAAWVLPSVVGPPIAGWLAVHVSWRAVFLVVPPLVVPALLALLPRLTRLRPRATAGHQDQPRRGGLARAARGVGVAGGAFLLQVGFQGGTGAARVGLGVVGAALVVASLPGLLPPGTLRLRRGLPTVVAVRGMYTAAFFGAETFVPLMLVSQRGLDPAVAGLTLTGAALGWSAGSYVQGRPGLPVTRFTLLWVGGLLVGVCTLGLMPTPWPGTPVWVIAPVWAVGGLGMGLAMSSTSVLTLSLSAPGEEGRNSAGLQLSDSLGGVLGIGVAGAIFASMHRPSGDDARAFTLIWLVLGVVGSLSALVALRASPTRGQRRTCNVSSVESAA